MTAHAVADRELLTIEQWEEANAASQRRLELVRGQLVEVGEATTEHNRALTKLVVLLYLLLPRTLWEVLAAGSGVATDRRGPQSGLIPDVLVLHRAAVGRKTRTYEPADVLLAVEVVSPSTVGVDRRDKRAEYERAGIAHYWIVDIREESRGPKLTVLKLVDGAYQEQNCGPGADGGVSIDLAGQVVSFHWDELLD